MAAVKYKVNAQTREGFVDRRRAGEAWPRGAGNFRLVTVVDTEDDPPGRQLDGEFAIGQATFKQLKADPEIFVDLASTGPVVDKEKDALRARVAELEAALEAAKGGGAGGEADKGKGKAKGA